jgi:hypothetical protein
MNSNINRLNPNDAIEKRMKYVMARRRGINPNLGKIITEEMELKGEKLIEKTREISLVLLNRSDQVEKTITSLKKELESIKFLEPAEIQLEKTALFIQGLKQVNSIQSENLKIAEKEFIKIQQKKEELTITHNNLTYLCKSAKGKKYPFQEFLLDCGENLSEKIFEDKN